MRLMSHKPGTVNHIRVIHINRFQKQVVFFRVIFQICILNNNVFTVCFLNGAVNSCSLSLIVGLGIQTDIHLRIGSHIGFYALNGIVF
ncbi:hypothetical protein D3C80_1498190 [compost metagenome]